MNNIVYADTVGIDGTVYPTIGENIRNSSMLMNAKEIIRLKVTIKQNEPLMTEPNIITGYQTYLSVPNKNIFIIRVLNLNISGDDYDYFLHTALVDNHLGIKIRANTTANLTGQINLLVGGFINVY